MAQESKFNLLPDEEKKKAEEELKGSTKASQQVKLVVPKMDEAAKAGKKKGESWWSRRKRLKAEKKAAKMRKKGETGSAQMSTNKKKTAIQSTESLRPELFSDVMKQEPNQHWWEKKSAAPEKEMVKKEVMPVAKQKQEEKREAPKGTRLAMKEPMAKTTKPARKMEEIKPSMKKMPAPAGMHEPSAGMSFDGPSINLVPEGVQSSSRATKVWPLAMAIVIFAVAFWVIIGGLTYARVSKAQTQNQQLRTQITQLDRVISDAQASRQAAKQLQSQYDAVAGLVDNHVYWTVFLQKLEDLTIPDVYYVALDGDLSTNKVSLRMIAKDYASAARQIRSFERSGGIIQSVHVGEARVENQPQVRLPVPIVAVDLELTLVDGALKVFPETSSSN